MQRGLSEALHEPIASEVSPTSLQLAPGEPQAPSPGPANTSTPSPRAPDQYPDIIGYAFAINGKLSSVDLYASPACFASYGRNC